MTKFCRGLLSKIEFRCMSYKGILNPVHLIKLLIKLFLIMVENCTSKTFYRFEICCNVQSIFKA